MKIPNQYLQSLTIIGFLFCFNGQGKSQTPKHLFIIEERVENSYRRTSTTQDLKATLDEYRKNPQKAKTPLILAVKLPYYPLFESTKGVSDKTNPKRILPASAPNIYSGNQITFFTKSYSSYNIPDSSTASLLALGITPENAADYRYRVVEDDSAEIIPWSPIPKLEQKYGAQKPYGYIGDFKGAGKMLLIEVVNRKNYNIRDGVVFYWTSNNKPEIRDIGFSIRNKKTGMSEWQSLKEYATHFDKKTGLPLDLRIPINLMDLVVYLKKQPTIAYTYDIINKNAKGKETISSPNILINQDGQGIYDNSFYTVGKYELIIRRSGYLDYSDQNVIRIPFEVYKPKEQRMKELRTIILGWAVLVLLLSTILFVIFYRRYRRKLKRTLQQKEKVNLQLKVIRSQLNPHFTFNALTSIQNLMNKNDAEAANHYLAKFSSLTRRVLTTSDNDLISLADEITLLDDYLQMEQLRFGFTYAINADEALNKENIEIPAMLLQPFVENAVKHGVAMLRENGHIEILFSKHNRDLVLSVTDNGAGFNEQQNTGMGLKLSRERISLLNSLYPNQTIAMKIYPTSNGTKISITLGDWI